MSTTVNQPIEMSPSDACGSTLSIALVTRNRPWSLERFLQSIGQQTAKPFEIVISDDSDEEQAAKVRCLAERYGCRYVAGPKNGLYANRNNAARACKGTHILSADDDHTHPPGYLQKVHELIREDPNRIWVISERNPGRPDVPHHCPPELYPDGRIGVPIDNQNCAAIADGSTVYPSDVFKASSYDESFAFGGLWYLWGKSLQRQGWKLSYCPDTYIWHHLEQSRGRSTDVAFLRHQLCCNCYVLSVNAFLLEKNPAGICRALYHLLKSVFVADTIQGYDVTTRLRIRDLFLVLHKVAQARVWYKQADRLTGPLAL